MMTELQRVRLVRLLGISEGISFLVLLLIAMPVKYIWHLPGMVTVVGWIHGALFIAYGIVVLLAAKALRYPLFRVGVACAAALLPVGTFLLDRGWRKRERELRQAEKHV